MRAAVMAAAFRGNITRSTQTHRGAKSSPAAYHYQVNEQRAHRFNASGWPAYTRAAFDCINKNTIGITEDIRFISQRKYFKIILKLYF